MKKLMFAAAIAASAAAFAAPINAISFENSQYASIDNATNLTGKADIPDPGRESATGATGYYFLYAAQSGSSDSSFVTNVAAAFTENGTAYFAGLENYSNQKFLALDTEGGTLWRSIGQLTGNNDALGAVTNVAATGTYLDTLVQFTVTEDEAPMVNPGDKLAIWLQAEEGVTNLMVRAANVKDTGSVVTPATNYVVSCGKRIVPGQWYRLTVKAIPDVSKSSTDDPGNAILGFLIYIDGDPVVAAESTFDSSYIATATDADWGWISDGDTTTIPLLQSKTVFPSLEGMSSSATLQAVGFQGTGAVDEIVWTEEDLFPAATTTIEFTLTGGANAAVSYAIGSGEPQNWDGTSTISVDSGATVTFTATPNADFTYDTVSAVGWTPSNGSLTYTTNVTEATTLTVPDAIALYSLTIPNVANATASISGGYQIVNGVAKIPAGQTVTITWEPDSNYRLVGNASLELEVTGNTDLTNDSRVPTTADKFYTLTLTTNELSAAQFAVGVDALADYAEAVSVEYGTNVTVTVAPNSGYEYATEPSGWTLDSVSGAISTNFIIEAAVTLEIPTPAKIAYNLTITADATKVDYTATVNGESAGSTVNIGDVIVITATAKTGYNYTETPEGWTAGEGVITKTITVETADVEVTIPAPAEDAPAGIEIEAGQQGGTTYATEADAAAVTNNVTVTVPAAVAAAGVDATAYKANFEPKVVSDGNGGYKVEIGLTAAAEAALQTQANTDAGTLVSDITASAVTITTTPGFYYSVKYGSSLNAMNSQTAGVLADGETKSITLPTKSGTSGFYKVVISIVPNEAVTP